jgi:Na+/H+-dicarboxylate symporter
MKLHWKIILGMLLGIVWSIISAKLGWSAFTNDWIAPFGKIFVNLLKLIALPLVLFSVIGGVTGIGDPEHLGKLGLRTLGLYLLTTIFAVSLGLVLVNVFEPGKSLDNQTRLENRINYELWAKSENIPLKDELCYSCEKENNILVSKVQKKLENNKVSETVNTKLNTANKTLKAGPLQPLVDVVPKNIFASLSNGSMLPIIFFAIFFGISVLYIPKRQSEIVINFINAINEVFLKMIDFIMKISPFFVFTLMAGLITSMAGDDLGKMLLWLF